MTMQAARRIALVTGATGAIGEAIALGIAREPGFEVVLGVRNVEKGARAAERIRRETGNTEVRVESLDVSRRISVLDLVHRWDGPLHVLVNNAAQSPKKRTQTPEGIEVQWATNVLGYFWMIDAFSELLKASAPARIVNVASYWAGDLDLGDPEFKRRRYDNDTAYRQSKQADRMLTAAFAGRLQDTGVTVNACHPGDVPSKLSRDLGFGGHQSPGEGADTPVWLATSSGTDNVSDAYFSRRQAEVDPFVRQRADVETLFCVCDAYN